MREINKKKRKAEGWLEGESNSKEAKTSLTSSSLSSSGRAPENKQEVSSELPADALYQAALSLKKTVHSLVESNANIATIEAYQKEVVSFLKRATAQGHGEAEGELGRCYHYGYGVPCNVKTAKELYQSSATKGVAESQYAFGQRCNLEDEPELAARWWKAAAKQGHGMAAVRLGEYFRQGLGGLPMDLEGAAKCHKAGIEQLQKKVGNGDAWAATHLAVCYFNGMGIAKDESKVMEYCQKVAEAGEAYGQYQLGWYLENGAGVTKNLPAAMRWYKKAGLQGLPLGQFHTGLCYSSEHHGRPKNPEAAKPWFQEAAKWFEKAAMQGQLAAQYSLAECYFRGRGVERNLPKAAEWFEKAAMQGHLAAQSNIGACYLNGEGVLKNLATAANWLEKAAARNDQLALFNLGLLYIEQREYDLAENLFIALVDAKKHRLAKGPRES